MGSPLKLWHMTVGQSIVAWEGVQKLREAVAEHHKNPPVLVMTQETLAEYMSTEST